MLAPSVENMELKSYGDAFAVVGNIELWEQRAVGT